MSIRRSIRNRRMRRTIHKDFDLQLTSMMDILVIILVFLLKSYSASTNSFSTVAGIQLPLSKSQSLPSDSLHLLVTPDAILFEGKKVVEFGPAVYQFKADDLAEENRLVVKLLDVLTRKRIEIENMKVKSVLRDEKGNPLAFHAVIAIQADKSVRYDVLRKIMYTAGVADFRIFRLLAARQEM
jgi:biopolymer transport protein ExbD